MGIKLSSDFLVGKVGIFVDGSKVFTVLRAEAFVKLDSFNTKSKIVRFYKSFCS